MDNSSLVREGAVGADEDVLRDSLAEDLDAEDIGNDLLGFALDVGVHESDVVVAADDVAEGREALFDTLDADSVGEGVAEVLEFLVGGGGGEEETAAVTTGY